MAEELLAEILDAALLIAGADRGHIQLLDSVSGKLTIRVQRGFNQEWLDDWTAIDESRGAGGAALRKGERVIIEDVRTSPVLADTPAMERKLKAGVHAVQSTPLMNRAGKMFGVLSTHFRRPHRPDDRTLRVLDLLAQQTSEILERTEAGATLKDKTDP